MTTDVDDASSMPVYELSCTDCSFETRVRGTVYDALEEAKSHRVEYGEPHRDHFVNFSLEDHS